MVDQRHTRRVVAIAKRAMAAPRASFPRMMRDDSELEGAYRLFSNPSVSPSSILDAHYAATAARIRDSDQPCVVVHDTTDCYFRGDTEREGVGKLSNQAKGLSVHVALAVAPDGGPHGLLDVSTHTRLKKVRSASEKRAPARRESARWGKTVERAMSRLGPGASQAVHVMDREADHYLLFEAMVREGRAFVIRIGQNRRIDDGEHKYLRDAIEQADAMVEREVRLSKRSDLNRRLTAKKTHPARKTRLAHLSVGARTLTIPCGWRNDRHVERLELTLNVVRVWEPNPPSGEAPVEWLLITNLPTTTASQLEVVVDAYRLRWTVEEYFKALKTGCAYERRQLESRHALENALAILAPIACRLLLLRTLARREPNAPATDVLTADQVEVLRTISVRFKLPKNPTVQEALYAIAGLGGFLRRNKTPGWQTIGLGFEELLQAEHVWNVARTVKRCDQS